MTRSEYIELYEKYMTGECTPQEEKLLEGYSDDFQLSERPWNDNMGDQQEIKDRIINKLNKSRSSIWEKLLKNRYRNIAAVLLIMISAGLLFNKKPGTPANILAKQLKTDNGPVIPGSNKATLTLSDGSNIDLNDTEKGVLSNQGSVSVDKLSDGKLVYNIKGEGSHSQSAPILYNTITTPRGGQYQVVLADGTKVWLNSESSLKFPATFSGKERHVELTGEAYFEVAKNKNMPFKIAVNKMSIEVLGTHFNVNAYADDDEIKTTLLEGSVKLASGSNTALLKPGEQGVLQQQSFKINAVNTEETVAWKNGYFMFDNENIQSIMKKVARWYNVDVVYTGNIDERGFGGTVSRFESVTGVLKSLELTGTVHFKLEGRRITVMP
jgi:transmembrane sensor